MSQIFFTGDTHFDHRMLSIKYRHGPWADHLEMTEVLIDKWNARVGKGDLVYHLGDFSFAGSTRTNELISRLNGQIHLIRGNHDGGLNAANRAKFASFQQYKEIKIGEQRICLFHFPIMSWHMAHHGSWMLHGHCHGNLRDDGITPRIDVGVDCFEFAPVSFEEIEVKMEDRIYLPVDHHD